MIIGDAAMISVTLLAALIAMRVGTPIELLIIVALLVGTVSAFYMPASGSMPRRLVPQSAVPRALALRQTVGNGVALVGAPVGGFLVAYGGLSASLLFSFATFSIMLIILVFFVRSPAAENGDDSPPKRVLREIADGATLAAREPLLRSTLVVIGGAAAFLLPTMTLLVPLLARVEGCTASTTGLIIGLFSGSSAVVAFVIAITKAFARAGLAAGAGLVIAAAGVAIVAYGGPMWVGIVGATIAGAGSGMFGTHAGALILRATPERYLSRIQSINVLVQSCPLLLANIALGALADRIGVRPVVLGCACLTAAVGLYGCLSRPSRTSTLG
jgi:MFS family permease